MDGHAVVVHRLPGVPLPRKSSTAPAEPALPRSKRFRVPRKLGRVALNFVFVAAVACAVMMIGPAVLGFHRYVILTGSMTGTYDRGSVVFDRPTPVSDLKVGDPITYAPPPGFTTGDQSRVTHRIFAITRGVNGARIFKTKGDANQRPDVWTFTLNQPMQDRVVAHVPDVGYLFLLLSLREFRFVLVGVPALLIGLFLLRQVWRQGGEEVRRQKLAERGWRALPDAGSGAVLPPLDTPVADRIPPQLDLRLKRLRAGPAGGAARPDVALRPRLDLRLPLRVGRLASALTANAHPDLSSPVGHEQLGPGASIATIRLLVTREIYVSTK
ncbi:MAG: signal peptidase [Solirubrobacteraceae bacterium]|nr:signal peptidase [Solirubrobacteraceae bacterium]